MGHTFLPSARDASRFILSRLGSCRHFGIVPSLRQIVLGTSLFSRETFLNRVAQSPLVSATSMLQIGREPSGTRVAIKSRYEWREVNRWIAEEASMGTALAVTQQQSIEAGGLEVGQESTARIVVHAAVDSWSPSGARICRTTPLSAACNVARSSTRSFCTTEEPCKDR